MSGSDSVWDGQPVNSAFESFWYFCDKLTTLYFWSLFKAVPYHSQALYILTGTEDMTHGYCISSQVLRIWLTGTAYRHRKLRLWLTGTEDMTHGYCRSSQVSRIWVTGTKDMSHGYWGYDSWVLMIWLTGTAYPHRYWGYDSRVLHIVHTGWAIIKGCARWVCTVTSESSLHFSTQKNFHLIPCFILGCPPPPPPPP